MKIESFDGLPEGYWEDLEARSPDDLASVLSDPSMLEFTLARLGYGKESLDTFLTNFNTAEGEKARRVAIMGAGNERRAGLDDIIMFSRILKLRKESLEGQNSISVDDLKREVSESDELAVSLGNFLADLVNDAGGPAALEALAAKLRGDPKSGDKGGAGALRGIVWTGFCSCFMGLKRLPSRREHREVVFKHKSFHEGGAGRKNFSEYRNQLGLKGLPGPD